MEDWTTINEELYNNFAGNVLDTAHALARGKQTAKNKKGEEVKGDNIVVWTNRYHGKRRCLPPRWATTTQTVADPRYLDLVTRGLLWSCDKLNDTYLKPVDGTASLAPAAGPQPTLAK